MLPLLVTAARTAAACTSPTPLLLAGIVVLVYGIITILQHLTEQQQHRLHASTRQCATSAQQELRDHPAVFTSIQQAPQRAAQAPVHELSNARHERRSANSTQPKRSNLFSDKAKPWSSAESSRGRTW
jgi:hypothetical protein